MAKKKRPSASSAAASKLDAAVAGALEGKSVDEPDIEESLKDLLDKGIDEGDEKLGGLSEDLLDYIPGSETKKTAGEYLDKGRSSLKEALSLSPGKKSEKGETAEEAPRPEIYVAFHFSVTFQPPEEDPFSVMFSEVSGMSVQLQTEDLTEGGENTFTYPLPKPPKYETLKLKRAMVKDGKKLIEWAKHAIDDFIIEPWGVEVSLLDENHTAIRTWNFTNAYPVKLSVSELGASKNEIVMETIELAYQYFRG